MQDTKIEQTKNKAHKLLSRSLQELNSQKNSSDISAVATQLQLPEQTVATYLAGNIDHLETGRQIFPTLRYMIIDRENKLKMIDNDEWLMAND